MQGGLDSEREESNDPRKLRGSLRAPFEIVFYITLFCWLKKRTNVHIIE